MAYKKNIVEKLIFIFLTTLVFINVILAIFSSGNKYRNFNFWNGFPGLKNAYRSSQYVNKHPVGWIPDETVNAYAGAEYIRGINPVLIASDTPPLGRYIIGLSEQIFNNENITTLIFAGISLLIMYLIGKQIFNNVLLSLIAPLLFSFEPIFKNQIIYSPLLDIFQLAFLLSFLFLFNKSLKTKKYLIFLILANVSLGLFISTKFFITGIALSGTALMVFFLRKEWEKLKYFIITLPIALFVLLLSYIRVLFFNHNFIKFLGIQKYVFIYHKSQLILPLSVWPLLLLNKWYVWYGNKPFISDAQWSITWPIITIVSILTLLLYLFKKIKLNRNIEVVMAWSTLYLIFLSAGQITSRYFVILIPILYIISVYGIVEILKLKFPKLVKFLK